MGNRLWRFLGVFMVVVLLGASLVAWTHYQAAQVLSNAAKGRVKPPVLTEPALPSAPPVHVLSASSLPPPPPLASPPHAVKSHTALTQPMIKPSINPVSKPATGQDIYHQLAQNLQLDIELAWPQNKGKRETLLDYLYTCLAAEFALLDGQTLVYLSPNTFERKSAWLRVVHGSLSAQEQRWINGARATGTAVRLLPERVDQRLSAYISEALGDESLISLYGQYQLTHSQLYLNHIIINGKQIESEWLLSAGSANCR
ncbi:hypothetical protein [Alteromonas sp. C1M14]|uniref:hypothetical protein n=1 Tax=Alteromonas sp. C1M14 TaxID=2841567 RepID=UPI001C0A0E7C|nr:hypothetical protein [Alteromonas sp. C1M14]MBU2978209.1 hypothetical protein [Alteromonas sp. C1M14]